MIFILNQIMKGRLRKLAHTHIQSTNFDKALAICLTDKCPIKKISLLKELQICKEEIKQILLVVSIDNTVIKNFISIKN